MSFPVFCLELIWSRAVFLLSHLPVLPSNHALNTTTTDPTDAAHQDTLDLSQSLSSVPCMDGGCPTTVDRQLVFASKHVLSAGGKISVFPINMCILQVDQRGFFIIACLLHSWISPFFRCLTALKTNRNTPRRVGRESSSSVRMDVQSLSHALCKTTMLHL